MDVYTYQIELKHIKYNIINDYKYHDFSMIFIYRDTKVTSFVQTMSLATEFLQTNKKYKIFMYPSFYYFY